MEDDDDIYDPIQRIMDIATAAIERAMAESDDIRIGDVAFGLSILAGRYSERMHEEIRYS